MSGGPGEAGAPQGENARPLLSVVIPVWNRRDVIRRCLDSVLTQDFGDFEVIVVDDGSTDDSPAVMASYADPRLRVLRHAENRGVCAARDTGTRAARGAWIVYVDSDWALEPGALRRLEPMVRRAPPDVGIVGGSMRMDTGALSPAVPPPEDPFGYIEYLRWIETGGAGDHLTCWRRQVFDEFRWPTDRRWEAGFFFQVASRWKKWVARDVLVVQYTQCANRLTEDSTVTSGERRLAMAPALAQDVDETLDRFGADLRTHAPHCYGNCLEGGAMWNFLAGRRGKGLRFACRAWLFSPWKVHVLGIAVAGLVGARCLLAVRRFTWVRFLLRKLVHLGWRRGAGGPTPGRT